MDMKSHEPSPAAPSPSAPELTELQLLGAMRAEFDRLNGQYFGGELILPTIVISRRKAYGGYYQPARHRIVLSWQAYREHGWEETLNTFRHEVAHIKHPNHSKAFWELAARLGVTKRYASAPLTPPRTPHRYVYGCPACGRRVHRNRRIRQASCGACDKNYNPNFALKLLSDEQR